jgi:F0F1-type ATP synthase assembly protein I
MGDVMAASEESRDGRNSVARGYVLATKVSSIGMQMAFPPLIGWWIDTKWGTTPWMLMLGACLGFVISLLELIKFANDSNRKR